MPMSKPCNEAGSRGYFPSAMLSYASPNHTASRRAAIPHMSAAEAETPASAAPARRRPTGEERKRQIVRVTLDLVARYGVGGTTTARIAAETGVSERALYMHFPSRRDMLAAALELAFDRANDVVRASAGTDPIERLRAIGRAHWPTVVRQNDGFVYPLYEFIAAPASAGLRETISVRQMASVRLLADIVEEGKQQGLVRPDANSEQVAWELMSVYMSEDLAFLMGVEEFATKGRSATMLEHILRDLLVTAPGR